MCVSYLLWNVFEKSLSISFKKIFFPHIATVFIVFSFFVFFSRLTLFCLWVPVGHFFESYQDSQSIVFACWGQDNERVFLSQDSTLWSLKKNRWIRLGEVPHGDIIQKIWALSSQKIVLLTNHALYMCDLSSKVFFEKCPLPFTEKITATYFFQEKGEFWILTSDKLFFSNDFRKWKKSPFPKDSGIVEDIVVVEKNVFFLTDQGIYCLNRKKRSFLLLLQHDFLDENESKRNFFSKKMIFDSQSKILWIYWRGQISAFFLEKFSKKYRKIASFHVVKGAVVRDFSILKEPWILTSKGLFTLKTDSEYWSSPDGMVKNFFGKKIWRGHQTLFIFKEGVLYKWLSYDPTAFLKNRQMFLNEPTIQKVQKKVLSYMRFSGDFLSEMERSRQKMPWIPKVTLSFNSDRQRDWKVYANGQMIPVPCEKEKSLTVTCVWDFKKFALAKVQDKWSKKFSKWIELRQKVLKEVTKVYFERRKEQIALFFESSWNQKQELSKKIHIEELTARLDSYTGGWFSSHSDRRCLQ